MTPMPLEKALEVAIKRLQGIAVFAEADEAAATLRAFKEKGLPLIREQEHWLPMLLEVIDEPDKLRDPWREAYYRVQGKEAP